MVSDPGALFDLIACGMKVIDEADDVDLLRAMHLTMNAVLRDTRITRSGTKRPWLDSSPGRMEVKQFDVDLTAPIVDLQCFWRQGLEVLDLIDAGHRLTSRDFPVPLLTVCEACDDLKLEGSIEDAHTKLQALLIEAQEARQWSIPWGARVEVAFPPFVAVRVFELDGEFACHFLDQNDRYLHVAIGLRGRPLAPRLLIFQEL